MNVGCAPYPGACPDSAGLPLTREGHRKKNLHGYLHPFAGDSVALAKGAVQVSSRMGLDTDSVTSIINGISEYVAYIFLD